MNRPRRLWICLVVTFVAITAASYAAPRPTTSPAARKLLEATFATYQRVHSYREEGVVVYEQRMPGMYMRMDMHYTLAYRTPNFLYYDRGPGLASSRVVCDGRSLYSAASTFGGAIGQVVKAPAPTDAAKVLSPKLIAGMPPMAEAPVFGAPGLISGEINMSGVESVRTGLPSGNRWFASLTRPRGTRSVTVYLKKNPMPLVVWIDTRTHAVRQVATDLSQEGIRGYMRQAAGGAGEPPAGVLDMFKDMTVRTVMTLRKVEFNKPIPDAVFRFTLPKGAKIVEVKSVDEIAGAAMGGEAPSPPSMEEGPTEIDITGKAPIDFTAADLDGKPVAVSSFKGKPLVLDFCATWCPPCRAELPVLDEAFGKFKDQGLQVVAVFMDSDLDTVKKFVAGGKYHFTVLWLDPACDEGRRVSKVFGITGIPRTLYIGGDWTVKTDSTGFGGKDETVKALATLGFKSE